MTTPAFNPIGSLFNNVRYFTQFDPYYYAIDNRPLTDMSQNSTTLSKGVDAARRVLLMETLNRDILSTVENSTSYSYFNGLAPSAPTNLTIRIGIGELLIPLAVNASISQTILKRGINQNYVDLPFTSPVSVGFEVVHTVEYRYVDIGVSTDNDTYFFDNGNSSIFDTALNGVLEFQIISGTPSDIAGGLVTPPSTTSGWSPLYNITVVYGASTWYKLWLHDNSPKLTKDNYLIQDLNIRLPSSGAGSLVTTYDPLPAWQLTDEGNQSIVASINLLEKVNLYKDINFKINFASTTTSGNIAFQVSYGVIASGATLSGISLTSNTAETIANPGTANALTVATLTGKVPGWALNNGGKILVLKFNRPTSDSSTGNMLITNITAYQSS